MDMISQGREQKHPVEKKSWVPGKDEWQQATILLTILGIEIPFIGGFWVWNNDPWYYALFLSVSIGAFLLRSWWARLIVPVVFAIGIALGILLFPLLQGGWPALQTRLDSGLKGVDILLFLGTPAVLCLAAFGATLGVSFGNWIKHGKEDARS